jgi:aminomethyltransferase
VRRTPLADRQRAAGGRMVDFAGWELPQQYSSVKAEQLAVRTGAGLFDVSHMGRFEVRGAAGGSLLQGLVTGDLSSLTEWSAQYTLLCREDGGVLDDLIVYREPRRWRLVVNAATREKDLDWLRRHATGEVEIVDRSEETCLLAAQGPRAAELLPAEGVNLAAVPGFGTASGAVAGVEVLLSRTGYTGEDGFELQVPAGSAAAVWDALLEAGFQPCGLACRDVCRLEAGLRLYGSDMDEQTTPYEAGLGWTVKLEKGQFPGRDALAAAKQAGRRRLLVGVRGGARVIPRHGAEVRREGRRVGAVTSGTYSFWLEGGIGFASVEAGTVAAGAEVAVETRDGAGPAEVVPLPFYRGSVRRAAVTT